MRVHHLNCGTLCTAFGIGGYGSSALGRGSRLVCHCLLVEYDRGLVLVDTGLGTRDLELPRDRLGGPFLRIFQPRLEATETAMERVCGLGYSPKDVRHIILTHLDLDHAGGVSDFPGARVHLHEAERRVATQRHGLVARLRYRPERWGTVRDWSTYEAGSGEAWFGFQAVRDLTELPSEILLVPLPGHSLGHCGVAIRQSSGWILHCGDAYYDRGEMDPPDPRCAVGLRCLQRLTEVDRRARLSNQARLRTLARDHPSEVKLFCSHDPMELLALTQSEIPLPAVGGSEREWIG